MGKYVNLPHQNPIRNYFGDIDIPGVNYMNVKRPLSPF